MSYSIDSLYIYPIKSLQGIRINRGLLVNEGLQYDRQWMLVDQHKQFLSQRKIAHMATLKTAIHNDTLVVSNAQGDSITLQLNARHAGNISVTVWHDTVMAYAENDSVNEWFSEQLGTPCKLVRLADNEQRLIDPDYAKAQEVVSFSDGFPLLIVAASNIDLLNSKLDMPVNMDRFRPNIVIDGLPPHGEDQIESIIINDIQIDLVKPCSRCSIPSIHQTSGIKRPDILRALLPYRQIGKKIYFGMNGIHKKCGLINTSDKIQIIFKQG